MPAGGRSCLSLPDRVAIITGAARGQGAAAARRFVAEGAHVFIGDVLDDLGKEVAESLGERAFYRHLDVTSEDDWAAVVGEVLENFGRVDVLVNNAGILRFAALPDMPLDDYMRIVNINQVGTFLGMRAVSKPMIAAGSRLDREHLLGRGAGRAWGCSPPTPARSSRSAA